MSQQHVVFGAGLIGGFLAGVLTSQGRDVAIVARASVREKFAKGMRLTDYHDNEADVESLSFVEEGGAIEVDYLWLTVKCTQVDAAVEQLVPMVGPDTHILCCQNGLGSETALKSRFPDNPVHRVMVQFNVVEMQAGHLHRGSEGAVTIESLPGDETAKNLAESINCGLLPVHDCDDMKSLLWAKLQLNLGNGVNALADIPVKAMLEQRDFRRCFALLMKELLAVCDAHEITLPKLTALPPKVLPRFLPLPDFLFTLLGNKMLAIDPTVRTSMWWDLNQGKQTEVHYLNGAVVAAGEAKGLACPANKALVDMIVAAEEGRLKPGLSANEMWRRLSAIAV